MSGGISVQGQRGHEWRRIAGALALLGIVVYSALIPGHLVSQLRADLVQGKLGDAYGVMCQSGVAGKTAPGSEDGKSQTDCPFCKNFASFNFAAPAPEAILLKRPGANSVVLPEEAAIATYRDGQIPLSRGPPTLSV